MRRIVTIFLVAMPFLFVSCEDMIGGIFDDLVDQISGNAQICVLDETGADTLHTNVFEFSAATNIDTVIDEIDLSYVVGLSAHGSLEEQEVDFPFLFYTFSDTLAGLHTVNLSVDTSFILNFDYMEFLNSNQDNMVAYIQDEETWYLASSGSLQLDSYEGYGGLVEGQFQNLVAYKITKADVDSIVADYESGNYVSMSERVENIQKVLLNGEFKSRNLDVLQFLE